MRFLVDGRRSLSLDSTFYRCKYRGGDRWGWLYNVVECSWGRQFSSVSMTNAGAPFCLPSKVWSDPLHRMPSDGKSVLLCEDLVTVSSVSLQFAITSDRW